MLDSWQASETMSGENAVYCEECKRHTTTKKWHRLTHLPDHIVVHMKRFDFNSETCESCKLYHRIEFSKSELDLKAYCDEDMQVDSVYDLQGIVVHSGSFDGGHYYSLLKDELEWLELNDETSLRFDPDGYYGLENDCFGGESVQWNSKTKRMETVRQRASAYMLVYAKSQRASRCPKSKVSVDAGGCEAVVKIQRAWRCRKQKVAALLARPVEKLRPEMFRVASRSSRPSLGSLSRALSSERPYIELDQVLQEPMKARFDNEHAGVDPELDREFLNQLCLDVARKAMEGALDLSELRSVSIISRVSESSDESSKACPLKIK